MIVLQTIRHVRARLRTQSIRTERSRHAASMQKESAAVALPPLSSPDDRLPVDVAPEDPTPDEIQRACQQIQSTWSDQERRYRAIVLRPKDLDESRASHEGFRA